MTLAHSLGRIFLASLPGAKPGAANPEAVGETLVQAIAGARHAYPGVEVDSAAFAAFLAGKVSARDFDPARPLAGLEPADLYLAFACERGDRRALAELEQRLSRIPAALAHLRLGAHALEEVVQALRSKLLLADGHGPKIASYAGRGPLGSWLSAAAVRTALNEMRGRKPTAGDPDEALAALPSPRLDPEVELIRARYEPQFKEAFQSALASLSERDRVLLRLHFLDGLGLDKLGDMYRVHRSTVARWIAHGRDEVFEKTRQTLREKLKIADSELASLLGVIRSQLDVSLHRFLGAPEREAE